MTESKDSRYSVYVASAADPDGNPIEWSLAARQPHAAEPRRMYHGPALGLSVADAQRTADVLRRQGQIVKVLADAPASTWVNQ